MKRERNACWRSRQSPGALNRVREESRLRRSQISLENQQNALAVSQEQLNVEKHSCGPLNVMCQYCQALHFIEERPSDGKFNSCCHKGKVKLPPRDTFPPFLKRSFEQPKCS